MQLNELCKESHERAKASGWWEPGKEKRPLECHALIVSEVAEAMEEVRSGKLPFYCMVPASMEQGPGAKEALDMSTLTKEQHQLLALQGRKPEGEAVELADAVIRIADWFGRHGWDMEAIVKAKMDYNATRGYRHGGKLA